MTISTKQFLQLISGMTDSESEQVRTEWESVLKSVQDLKPGETMEMDDLGVFTNVDGEITFEPDEDLAREVNFEYAGQEPIVIEPGESGSDSPIGMSSGDMDMDVDDAEEKPEEEEDDDLALFRPGGSTKPLFPDVDEVASQKDAAGESDSDDDEPGLDAVPENEKKREPETDSESPAESEKLAEDEDSAEGSSDDEQKTETAEGFETGDEKKQDDTPLFEKLSIDEEEDDEEDDPLQGAAAAGKSSDSRKPNIPDLEIDESVLAELKADEEAAEAEAKAEAAARKKEKDKEKEKNEKAKQLKDFNVYIAPRKTKSSPHPREVARIAGISIVALIAIGVIIWFVADQFGSAGDAPQTAATTEQPVTGPPPAAEETEIIEEITPEDATQPVPADQTEEPPPVEEPDPPAEPEEITPPADPDPVPQPAPETTPADPAETELPAGDYGLRGEIVNVPGISFGVVVFSLSSRENAERSVEEFRERGYRTKIVPVEQDGETRYRVSLGQFETAEAAAEAGQRLPEPYRNSFFISRFTP